MLSQKDNRRVYCTGFWHLKKNRKHLLDHYFSLLPETLAMLQGQRLHLFFDDAEIEAKFRAASRREGVEFSSEYRPLESLPTTEVVRPVLVTCENGAVPELSGAEKREKGRIHYHRDFLGSGEETFHALLAIWTSKIPLVAQFAETSACDEDIVAWVDASVSRFNGSRTQWDFSRCSLPPDALSHYSSPMRYYGQTLPLNASFLAARPLVWQRVAKLFLEEIDVRASDGYVHDEETIMSHVISRAPEAFHLLGRPVRGIGSLPMKLAYSIRSKTRRTKRFG